MKNDQIERLDPETTMSVSERKRLLKEELARRTAKLKSPPDSI